MRTNKGFTIIELLIVIVIIGILVAITAVSYTGITNSAKTAQAQSNARNVKQAILACEAKDSVLPTPSSTDQAAALKTCSGMDLSGITVSNVAPTAANAKSHIQYTQTSGAATITYWNSSASPAATTATL